MRRVLGEIWSRESAKGSRQTTPARERERDRERDSVLITNMET